MVSTKPSLAQFIALFTTGKHRLSIIQITHLFKFFNFRFLSRQNVENKFVLTNKFFLSKFNPIRRERCEKTCRTGSLECKYRVICVLVLGVICILRNAVSFDLKEEISKNYDLFHVLEPCRNENVQETHLAKVSYSQFTLFETFYSALAQRFT